MPTTIKTPRLENAQSLAARFPDAMKVPSVDELQAVRPGAFIKVCDAEGFWIKVAEVSPDETGDGLLFVGTIANGLILTGIHGLCLGDTVRASSRHVYSILEAA